MNRIVILRGISCSGKSTFANKLQETEGYHVVNRDSIRMRLMGEEGLLEYFKAGMDFALEEEITKIEERELVGHLIKGHKVVIDNTHIKRTYVQALVNIFYELKIPTEDVKIIQFEVSVREAKLRSMKRDNARVSGSVQERQYLEMQNEVFTIEDFIESKQWIPKTINKRGSITNASYKPRNWYVPEFETEPYVPNLAKPKAVIVDLDGTTAHRVILTEPYPHMRSYYSYKDVYKDEPDELTKTLIQLLDKARIELLFVSGRKCWDVEDCKMLHILSETRKYIENKLGIIMPNLFMRDPAYDVDENGNDLKDDLVKYRIFNQDIRDHYNVIGALDDRARVCALWEDIGIKCLNCASINEIGRY